MDGTMPVQRKHTTQGIGGFTQVKIVPEVVRKVHLEPIFIRFNGATIRLPGNFKASSLAKIIRCLGAGSRD